MAIYEINADGNALLLVKVEGDQIEVIDAMNGWGINIKNNITIIRKDE